MELEEAIEILNNMRSWDCREPNSKCVEAIETVLSHLTKQEKMIELMMQWVDDRDYTAEFCESKTECDEHCKTCIKQYFEKKVEETN